MAKALVKPAARIEKLLEHFGVDEREKILNDAVEYVRELRKTSASLMATVKSLLRYEDLLRNRFRRMQIKRRGFLFGLILRGGIRSQYTAIAEKYNRLLKLFDRDRQIYNRLLIDYLKNFRKRISRISWAGKLVPAKRTVFQIAWVKSNNVYLWAQRTFRSYIRAGYRQTEPWMRDLGYVMERASELIATLAAENKALESFIMNCESLSGVRTAVLKKLPVSISAMEECSKILDDNWDILREVDSILIKNDRVSFDALLDTIERSVKTMLTHERQILNEMIPVLRAYEAQVDQLLLAVHEKALKSA